MTPKTPRKHLLAGTVAAALSLSAAHAQNPAFAHGDLVLFFQKEGDTDTVYANLGNAATAFRGTAAGPDGTNQINFLNVGTELAAAFGPGWASDTALYAGLCAVFSTSTGTTLTNGDPARTLYVSSSRADVGSVGSANSTAWDMSLAGNTAMTSGASGILGMNTPFETTYTTAVAVSPTSTSFIDDKNPVSGGVQGNAFDNNFGGGVQQVGASGAWGSFGGAGSVEFALDLYRILARAAGGTSQAAPVSGQVAGELRVGSYEGTVTVNSSGQVSFISQGAVPTSTFTTWVNSFNPPLTNPADREPGADPDGDGFENLMEFVLNGNPSVSSSAIAPTLDASGANFVFNFNRRDDSESPETTLVFQHSTNLTTWTDVSIGAATSGVVTVAENGTSADGITVTISKGSNTKLFGRLKVVR